MTGSFVIFVINASNFEVLRVDLYALARCKRYNSYQDLPVIQRDVSRDSCMLIVGEVFLFLHWMFIFLSYHFVSDLII
jgi:hypothetical protein